MNIRAVGDLIASRGLIKISDRNGWAAGTVGIALGYNVQYDTVRVGFIDIKGRYTGEKTTVARSMVVEVPAPEQPDEPQAPECMTADEIRIAVATTQRLVVAEDAPQMAGTVDFATGIYPGGAAVSVLLIGPDEYAIPQSDRMVSARYLRTLPEDEIIPGHEYSKLFRCYQALCECGSLARVHRNGELANHERPYGSTGETYPGTFLCSHSGRAATLAAALKRDSGLTDAELRVARGVRAALEKGTGHPFAWERAARTAGF